MNLRSQQSASTCYVWGRDLSGTLDGAGGVGGLLATEVDGTWYFPLYDNNGNVTDYVSETGEVVASYEYDAFGRTIDKSGPMADVFPFRFSTKYYDAETGLYYYGYRYYSPELGRWLTRDPIEEDGGDNLYAFCENNGVNKYDCLGRNHKSRRRNCNLNALQYLCRLPSKFGVFGKETIKQWIFLPILSQ